MSRQQQNGSRRHTGRLLKIPPSLSIGLTAFLIWGVTFIGWVNAPRIVPDVRQLTRIGAMSFLPDYDVLIYLTAGLTAVAVCSLLIYRRPTGTSRPFTAFSERTARSGNSRFMDIAALLTVVSAVIMIDPGELAERAFIADGFHHLDFYVMGPLLAFQNGGALGTDVYSQYGSGWVLVFAFLASFAHVDHTLILGLMSVFGALYFLSYYLLLRQFTGNALWSFVGLLLGLQLQLFSGTDLPIWAFPSSSVLRCPFDMCLFCILLHFSRFPCRASVAAGALGALSFLFGTDTGIYVSVALGLFSVLHVLRTSPFRFRPELLWLWGSFGIVLFSGLFVASRGTLFQARFWSGYFESVLEYGGGFGALPIAALTSSPGHIVLLLIILSLYTIAVAGGFAAVVKKNATDRDLAMVTLGVVGFGTLMLFINRSHPFNLFHPILPACVLLTVRLADQFSSGSAGDLAVTRALRIRLPLFLVIILSLLLVTNERVHDYPSAATRGAQFIGGNHSSNEKKHLTDLINKINSVRDILGKLSQSNRVVLVGEDPTLWLLNLNLPPLGRYCPAVVINERQVEQMREAFRNSGAQVALVVSYPAVYGDIPDYFDSSWNVLYSDRELTILTGPDFDDSALNLHSETKGASGNP